MRISRTAVALVCSLAGASLGVGAVADAQAPTVMTQAYAWQRSDIDVPIGGTVQPFASTLVQGCYSYQRNSGLNTTNLSCLLANTGYNGYAGIVPLGDESAT